MELIMPVIYIGIWAVIIGAVWFWINPRSFGRVVGGKYLKATNGEPKKVAGSNILVLWIVGIIMTVIVWNIQPFGLVPLWLIWYQVIRKSSQISKEVSSDQSTQATGTE